MLKKDDKIDAEVIIQRLEQLELELVERKDSESVINLGISMLGPIKSFQDLESRYPNEVNLLKVSNLNW